MNAERVGDLAGTSRPGDDQLDCGRAPARRVPAPPAPRSYPSQEHRAVPRGVLQEVHATGEVDEPDGASGSGCVAATLLVLTAMHGSS
jgi:hypothetical protein